MKVFKNKFKNRIIGAGKAGGNAEDVYLTPPQPANLLQSTSTIKSLDLLSEGPIEGLCLPDGATAHGLDLLGAVYLNDTPIKEYEEKLYTTGDLKAANIQFVDRVSQASFGTALTNIKNNITTYQAGTDNSSGLAEIAKDGITKMESEISELFNNYDEYSPLISQLGLIQFNTQGVINLSNSVLRSNARAPIYTSFLLDGFQHERYVKVKNSEDIIRIPENIFAVVPDFSTTDFTSSDFSVFRQNRINNFIGGGILFFYIGDESFSPEKFFTTSDNTAAIESGQSGNYDVLSSGTSGISFLNVAKNQVSPPAGETVGKKLNLGASVDNNLRFNFNNVQFKFNHGNEFQKNLDGYGEIRRDYLINSRLLGPFIKGGEAGAEGTFLDQFGNEQTFSKVGSGNSDIRVNNTIESEFSTWNTNFNSLQQHDAFPYTHIVYQNDVDQVSPTIKIDLLRDTEAVHDATLGRTEPCSLRIDFDHGFNGDFDTRTGVNGLNDALSGGIAPKNIILNQFRENKKAGYFGIAEGGYLNAPYDINLKKNSVLKDLKVSNIRHMTTTIASGFGLDMNEVLYPNDSWKDVNRYVRISKTSFETESALIQRECSLASITEKINSKFYYPFSALGGVSFDARNFSTIPIRTYDAKLKKVLVPSNYSPLKAGGVDKRFIDNSSKYGLREIFQFNQGTQTQFAIAKNKIEIGTENFEISLKVKFGELRSSNNDQFIIDVDSNSATTPGRIAIFQRANAILCVIRTADPKPLGSTLLQLSGDVSSQSASDIFEISLKAVGNAITFSAVVGNTTVFSVAGTTERTNERTNFIYDPSASTGLIIGASFARGNVISNNTMIADLKIRKNNELINHWDGTIINTIRTGNSLKDKFGGNHAQITGGVTVLEDTSFVFGKNKEQVYIGNWDGTLKYAWTDNPAWILYDLLVNPVYGIRNQIDDLEDIDIFELYNIGRYCDAVDEDGFFDGLSDERGGLEPRYSCNLLLANSENAFNVIGNIASIFKAVSYWAGGSFNFSIDKPKEVSAIFNNSNVLDGTFNYADVTKQARFTRVEVFYADKRDYYKVKKEYVEDESGIRERGLVTNTQNGIGATSRSQARRIGKYVLLSNKLETEIVEFSTEQSALFLAPGDIIRIDDELKGFELNYGTVLNAGFEDNQPFIEIENSINTGNILTGESGSLYLYKKEGQTEIKSLYDIVKFNQSYQFGSDNDNFSGELNSEKIDTISSSFVFETKVTGVSFTNNSQSIRLNIEADQNNFNDVSGLINGSPFNLKMDNNVNNFFKIVNVKENEHNVYRVTALEYQSGKFDEIEIEDIQTIEEDYNIGVLNNAIDRPSQPTVEFTQPVGGTMTGNILGVLGSNETKYRISLYRPNGTYINKEFLKDDTQTPPVTFFSINNLIQAGDYELVPTAIKNPESVDGEKHFFTINANEVSSELYFKDVALKQESNVIKNKYNFINYATGESATSNDCFTFSMKNERAGLINFNSTESPYISIKLFDENNKLINKIWDKYTSNNFSLSKLYKEENLSNLRNYTLGFYLYNKNNILCDTFMYSVINKAPEIKINSQISDQEKIIFNLNAEGSLDTKAVEVYSSNDNLEFSKLKVENVNPAQENYQVPVFYEEINNYNLNYFKFVGKDIIGTGQISSGISGQILQPDGNSSLPINQISNQLNQSLLTVYFAQFDKDLQLSYSSNGSASFNFKGIENGRDIGYNVMLDCSYAHSGEQQTRKMSLNNLIELDISSQSSESEISFYKKNKRSWVDYGQKDLQISIDNQTGLRIEQINLEIEKYYK